MWFSYNGNKNFVSYEYGPWGKLKLIQEKNMVNISGVLYVNVSKW